MDFQNGVKFDMAVVMSDTLTAATAATLLKGVSIMRKTSGSPLEKSALDRPPSIPTREPSPWPTPPPTASSPACSPHRSSSPSSSKQHRKQQHPSPIVAFTREAGLSLICPLRITDNPQSTNGRFNSVRQLEGSALDSGPAR